MEQKKKAYIYLVVTTTIWGSMYVFCKYIFVLMDPLTLLFFRYMIGPLLLMLVYMGIGGKTAGLKLKKSDIKYILLIGVGGYLLGIGLQLIGTDLCDASVASLINSINPVVIILLASIILKEKATVKQKISVAMAVVGSVVIIGQLNGEGAFLGAIISIGAVICWSFGSVMVRFVSDRYDPMVISIWGMAVGGVCSAPFGIYKLALNPIALSDITPIFILSFFIVAVISTAGGFLFWNKALSMVDAATCSLFYPIQPLVSTVLGIILLSEQISWNFLIGAGLIVAGILYCVLTEPKARKGAVH